MKNSTPQSGPSAFRFHIPNFRARPSHAFTLIELLVVISIIIILMGLLFPAFRSVQEQAKKTQAKNDLSQIVTAVNAYNTDYGIYPMEASKQGVDTLVGDPGGTYDNNLVFNILRGISDGQWNSNNNLNQRQVAYIQGAPVRDADNPKNGFATKAVGSIKVGSFVDPWGHEYLVTLDGNYDGWTADYYPYSDVTYTQMDAGAGAGQRSSISVSCAAGSWGKDGQQGTANDKKLKGSDDVVSWQ